MVNTIPPNGNGETKTRLEWLFEDIRDIKGTVVDVNAKVDAIRLDLAVYREKLEQNDKGHTQNLAEHTTLMTNLDSFKNRAVGIFLSVFTIVVGIFAAHVFGKI